MVLHCSRRQMQSTRNLTVLQPLSREKAGGNPLSFVE